MKRLYRPDEGQMIAGVAAGIAQYFSIDVSLVRLIFVITMLMGGPGILAYIILWFVMPEESEVVYQDAMKRKNDELA